MSTHVPTSLIQLFDDNGEVLNGGSVTVYADETTTLLDLFTADDLTGAAANPIVLDSAGRHAMRYFANQSFKLLVKNASGGTISTRDNIDPGIPIGTGVLAITNGGTGATTAGTALSNLGAASAAELADVSAEVAALAGSLGGTDATHIASGTTAQRKVNPVDGDIRNNTTTIGLEKYDSSNAAWFLIADFDNFFNHIAEWAATAADQETATSNIAIVTPLIQQRHPSAAKCWASVAVAAGSPTLTTGYNVSSLTDTGPGQVTVNIGTDMSGATYAAGATLTEQPSLLAIAVITDKAAGSFRVRTGTAVGAADTNFTALDNADFDCWAFGDQ